MRFNDYEYSPTSIYSHRFFFIVTVSISITLALFVMAVVFHIDFYSTIIDQVVSHDAVLNLTNDYLIYVPLCLIGVWRWSVWIIKKMASLRYKPFSVRDQNPKNTISVIIPVYKENPVTFRRALESWQLNKPNEIIAVIDKSDKDCINIFKDFFGNNNNSRPWSKLIVTSKPGKREALADGIKIASGEIIALTDSDTIWAPNIKNELLAPFGDAMIAGVTARVHPIERSSFWQKVTDVFWDIRNYYDLPAQAANGKSLSCLSGRTSLYRRELILPKLDLFLNERILGKRKESGEDKCLTRLVQSDGWKTYYQESAVIYSDAASNFRTFCKQRIRWSRNSHNSDLLSLWQGWVWRRPFLAFFMIDRIISTFTLFLGPIFFAFAIYHQDFLAALSILILWIVGRGIKIIPHLRRNPKDRVMILPFIAINYLIAGIKLYALVTIKEQKFIRDRSTEGNRLQENMKVCINVFFTALIVFGLVYLVGIMYSGYGVK